MNKAVEYLKSYGIEYANGWIYNSSSLPGIKEAEKRRYSTLFDLLKDNFMILSVIANGIDWADIRTIELNPNLFTNAI